jgi:hypothetical protein
LENIVSDITRMFGLRPGCSASLTRDGCHYSFAPNGDLIDHEPVAVETDDMPPMAPSEQPEPALPEHDDELPF